MGKMKIFPQNRKAYFFSLDAFIALLLILGVVLFIKPTQTAHTFYEENVQEDLLIVLSSLQIGEINNSYVKQLIVNGNITNLNQSVLEQIGEFYANEKPEDKLLAQSILDDLNLQENIGLYFIKQSGEVAMATSGTLSYANATIILTARQIISGIQGGEGATGYSSRAFLFSENKVDYFYFGGYVGDGNITAKIKGAIIGANIEGVFSEDFDLFINNQPASSHTPTINMPYKINLADNLTMFNSGDNYIDFKASNSSHNLYIAGGFIRIVYNSSEFVSSNGKKYLQGIEGIINLYDSFYIPGILNSMEILLHYNSTYNLFLTIGNKTVYRGNSTGSDISVILTDANLSILDYSSMNEKTIPLRLGLENVSYIVNETLDADVFSVTDISGSMGWGFCSVIGGWCLLQWGCENRCGGNWQIPLDLAKQANEVFIDAVLNYSGNKVGLVGYSTNVNAGDYHQLSNDDISLKNKVNSWNAVGGTCICCGINKAVDELVANSPEENFRSMVVMSDGEANRRCAEQGTGNAKQDAIQAACDAYDNYNIKVYAIGFGDNADNITLQDIGIGCGHGGYYEGGVDDLVGIYNQIAQQIIEASYFEQTVVAEGVYTKLYADSYISFDYDKDIPHGMIITAETPEFGAGAPIGTLDLPSNTTPYEVRVISYSGSKWTSKVEINNSVLGNWDSVFDLKNYNDSYINLGDPYVVNIPISKLAEGENYINVSIGLNSNNYTAGSQYNKIIYSLVKNISSFSPVVPFAEGCNWSIEFEDGSNEIISIPANYSGEDMCYYNSSIENPFAIYKDNDAIEVAIFNLLKSLDLNLNGKIETKFTENDLTMSGVIYSGIPFAWETEVQVRVWR